MNAQAEWFLNQSHKVFISSSSGWVELFRGVYQAFPYSALIDPTVNEIKDFFSKTHAIAMRFSTPLVNQIGHISYHVILEKTDYTLMSLPKKARHDVIHGLEDATYEPISFQRLAYEGWQLRYETLIRQGRQQAETRQSWERLCLCAEGLQGFEAWGAINQGGLVAAILVFSLDDTVNILYQQSKTEHMKFGVNNALTFVFTQAAIQRFQTKYIFYGLNSLDAPPGVDEFKFRMGYKAKPVRQRVVFNPGLSFVVNPLTHGLLKGILRGFPGNPTLAKAEGMVRFYLEGKKSLEQQVWPEILAGQREAILSDRG